MTYPSPSQRPASAAPLTKSGGWRRWGCGCALVWAALIGLPLLTGLAVYLSYAVPDSFALDEELAYVREQGAPISVEEMHAFYATSPEIDAATRHWQAAIALTGTPEFQQASKGLPTVDRPAAEAPLEGETLRRAREFVEMYRPALDEARAARDAGSVGRFPIEFEDLINALLPHAQGLRAIPNLARLDLETHLAEGDLSPLDLDACIDDIELTIAAGEALANEPLLVSQLVRMTCHGVAFEMLKELLAAAELDDAQLARLQDAFASLDYEPGFRKSLAGERFMCLHVIGGETLGMPEINYLKWAPFRDGDIAQTLAHYRPIEEAAKADGLLAAYRAAELVEADLELLSQNKSRLDTIRHVGTLLMFPAMKASTVACLRADASALAAETAIAWERYRLANGDWPEKLDDLAPTYVAESPLDPFDEKPLRYVIHGQSATIYSIGQDFIDQNGLDDVAQGDVAIRLTADAKRAAP